MRIVIALLCAVATGASAGGEQATTRPADLSSPRAALTTYCHAIKSADLATAKKVLRTSDAQDKELVDLGVVFHIEVEKLVAAVEQKFGDGAAATVRQTLRKSGPSTFIPALEKALPDAPADVTGDATEFRVADDQPVLKLSRANGEWAIDMTATVSYLTPEQRERILTSLPPITKKMKECSDGIAAGAIATVDDVMSRINPPERGPN